MNEKPKIKFLLAQVSKAVIFEIYEMDERFRSRSGAPSIFFRSCNGFDIKSTIRPALNGTSVNLQGDRLSTDNDCCSIVFNTPEEAKRYYAKVLEALKDWADNWEGWDEKPTESNDDPNVYTFY